MTNRRNAFKAAFAAICSPMVAILPAPKAKPCPPCPWAMTIPKTDPTYISNERHLRMLRLMREKGPTECIAWKVQYRNK